MICVVNVATLEPFHMLLLKKLVVISTDFNCLVIVEEFLMHAVMEQVRLIYMYTV